MGTPLTLAEVVQKIEDGAFYEDYDWAIAATRILRATVEMYERNAQDIYAACIGPRIEAPTPDWATPEAQETMERLKRVSGIEAIIRDEPVARIGETDLYPADLDKLKQAMDEEGVSVKLVEGGFDPAGRAGFNPSAYDWATPETREMIERLCDDKPYSPAKSALFSADAAGAAAAKLASRLADIHDSSQGGTRAQPDTEENWTGERRARYWQQCAFAFQSALSAIVSYCRDQEGGAPFLTTGLGVLINRAEDILKDVNAADFNIEQYLRDSRQHKMMKWADRSFVGESNGTRALRMLEEAFEVFLAVIFLEDPGGDSALHDKAENMMSQRWREAHHSHPSIPREIGQVAVTLGILAQRLGVSVALEEEREFIRVVGIPKSVWAARQAEKQGQGF